MIIRPSFTVVIGAAVGLVAGAVVYGAVTTASAASTTSVKSVKAVAASPLPAARCAAGQTLEDGVCTIHVQRTVIVPAPAAAPVAAPVAAAPSAARAQSSGVRAADAQPKTALAPLTSVKAEARDHEAKQGADDESREQSRANGTAGQAPSED